MNKKRSIRNKSTQTGEFVICHTDMSLTAQTVRIIHSSRTFLSSDGILMEFTGSVPILCPRTTVPLSHCDHIIGNSALVICVMKVKRSQSPLFVHLEETCNYSYWRSDFAIIYDDDDSIYIIFISSWVSSKSPSCSIIELVCILYYN